MDLKNGDRFMINSLFAVDEMKNFKLTQQFLVAVETWQ